MQEIVLVHYDSEWPCNCSYNLLNDGFSKLHPSERESTFFATEYDGFVHFASQELLMQV
jgi:hypothetical protein